MTPKTRTGARFGAYHRVSQVAGRDTESDSYMTEKVAWEQIDGWGKMRGIDTSARYLDRDVSGKSMDRDELNRMIEDLRAGVIDGIAVAQVDRLSRANVSDALKVVAEILEIAPGQLALLDLGIDPASEFGEFGLTVLLALARMQWRRYKRVWSTAQERAVSRGIFLGPAPLGYRTNGGPLEVDPVTGPVMKKAFEIAAADGLHAAVRHLGKPTKEVRRMLASRVYLGEVRFGQLVNSQAHDPLTTLATFEAAQAPPTRRARAGDYPLSGIARCECGAPLVGSTQHVKGHVYRRYRCSDRNCTPPLTSIRAETLETYVRGVLSTALGDSAIRLRYVPGGLEEAQEELERAESDRARWAADDRARDLMGDTEWYAGLEKRAAAVEQARVAYQGVAGQSARAEVLPAADQLNDRDQFDRALRAMVGAVELKPGKAPVEERATIQWM